MKNPRNTAEPPRAAYNEARVQAMPPLSRLTFRGVENTLRFLCRYHEYEAFDFHHVPTTGPALLAFHHSLATYDSFLLAQPIYDDLGRIFRGLADRLIFKTPILGRIFSDAGFIEGTREGTTKMLREGELIGFAPGGMREALRSSERKYEVDWEGRTGFVWLSMTTGAPIVLCACPRADDIYDVVENRVTPKIYARFRFPVPVFRGRWLTAVPRPIKLWHLISEPVYPEVAPDQVTREDVDAQHARLVARMQKLMKDSLEIGPTQELSPSRAREIMIEAGIESQSEP